MHSKNQVFYKLLFAILLIFSFSNGYSQQQPIPDWVKDIGGVGESKVAGVAVDKFDNIYIAGNFRSNITVDLSNISTPVNLSATGDYDVFIAKYTPDGKLIWAKSIGGQGLDQVNNLTVDNESNVIFGGQFNSFTMDADPGSGTFNLNNAGGNDAFIVKLDLDGNFKWAKSIGGFSTEYGHVVSTDLSGNVIFVGSYSSSINLGSFNLTAKGSLDGFMIKYDKNGNILWGYGFGSSSDDEIRHVITNTNNEIIIMGYFGNSIDLNPKGPSNIINGTIPNYFVAKYTETGQLIWANKVDGASATVSSLASGPSNDIYLTGVYTGTVNLRSPVTSIPLTSSGGKNLFVGKYSATGTALWARNIVGNAGNTPYSYYITADVDDNAYIGGYFDGTLTFGDATLNKTLTFNGGRDTFFGKYNSAGDYIWAFNFGSACSGNFGHKIAVDSKKNILLGGSFCRTVDFNPGICELKIRARNGTSDGYISKYNQIKFSGDANILSFELAEQTAPAIINPQNKTITIKVKARTDVTALKPTLTTDIGVVAPLSGIANNFTTPQKYIITSNCIDHTWLVTVLVEDVNEVMLCSGATQILTGNSTGNQPGNNFVWQIKNQNGDWVSAPNANTSSDYELKDFTNYTNANLTYYFRRKVTSGSTEVLEPEITVIINPATTNNTITTPETVLCNGAKTILISGTIPQGATNTSLSYKWQHSDDEQIWADINGETNQDLSVQVTKTIYFRRVTFSNNCSSVSNTLKIDFQPLITASFAGNNINLCKLNTATLNGNTTALNETGTWSVISPAYYAPFNSTNVNNPLAEITNLPPDIDVILKWTISQNTCLTTSSSTVTVHSYSEPVITMPSTLTINQGQSIQIPASVTPLSAGYTYRWTPRIGLDNPNILSPLASPDQTTIYRLTITYGNNCVVEKDIRIAVDKTTKISVCAGSLAQLSGDPILDQNPAIQWQVLSSGTWLNIQNANQANFSLKTDEQFSNQIETVLYRRAITAGNTTYIDSKYEVNTYPLTRNNVINTSTSNFCSNVVSSITINGTLPVGASNFPSTYTWERSSDGLNWSTINGETAKDIMISGLIQTTYFRRLTFTNGCPAISNILKITVNPLPTVANAGEDIALCGNSSLALTANPPGNNETGVWSVISPANYNPFNAGNVNNPNAVINHMPSNQKLILQWEIFNQNCGTSTKDEVEIISYRNILLQAPAELTVDFGKKINLGIVSDLTSDDGYTFEWLPKTGLDNPFTLSPDASPLENTIYTLKVNYGQTCEKTVNVLVKVLNNIKIPTSFSPNGDGVNDHWEIKNIANYPGSRVSVYNRYGTAIYKSTNYTAPWDGTHNGKVLPVGTYYYVILLKDKKNSVFNGSITIIQ